MKKIISSFFCLYLLTPMLVFAQSWVVNSSNQSSSPSGDLGEISDFFEQFIVFINNTLIPFVFAIALLMFLIGVFRYFIAGGGDEGSREQGKQLMLYAIIGFVVMVSIFGIVNLIVKGLGLDATGSDATLNMPSAPRDNY